MRSPKPLPPPTKRRFLLKRNSKDTYVLTVDPGSRGTGWALWRTGSWEALEGPVLTGVCYGNPKLDFSQSTRKIINKIAEALESKPLSEVYIEWPINFGNDRGEQAKDKGDINKLSFAIGAISQYAWEVKKANVILVSVNRWKGQLPKRIVNARIEKLLGDCSGFRSHAWDAVGLGLWAKGYFK
jgi:Holliday junction resolvasome RuvABC endonuclease subunit